MRRGAFSLSRRSVLMGGAAAALAWASRPLFQRASAQQAEPAIRALSVSRVPADPADPLWDRAKAAQIALNPQNIVLPRVLEAGAKAINVRALYDSQRLALLLEWPDAHRDVDLGTVLQYRDAVAVQFPEDLAQPTPSFTMGQPGSSVVIYHWKSDWQFGPLSDVDDAYPNMYSDWYPFSGVEAGEMPEATDYLTRGRKEYLTAAAVGNALADPRAQETIGPVQKMRAEGFGTLEPHPTQDAAGKGLWQDGGWKILVTVPRQQERFTFGGDQPVPLAFAVWDGSRDERNGKKAFSLWNTLVLGPAGGGVALPVVAGGIIAVVIAAAALVGLRRRRSRQPRGTG